MYTSKKARTIKARGLAEEQKWVGSSMGYTLIRSVDTSEKVHKAMFSRGFDGDVRIYEDFI